VTFPHTLQERKGPFTCPRCAGWIRFVTSEGLQHVAYIDPATGRMCAWLDEATDEQVEALK